MSLTARISGNIGRFIGEKLFLSINGANAAEFVVVDVTAMDFCIMEVGQLASSSGLSKPKQKAQWKRNPVWIGG